MGTTRTDGEKVELHQEVKLKFLKLTLKIDYIRYLLNFKTLKILCIQLLGGNQFSYVTNVSNQDDGKTNHNGSVTTRRWKHGGENYQSNCYL